MRGQVRWGRNREREREGVCVGLDRSSVKETEVSDLMSKETAVSEDSKFSKKAKKAEQRVDQGR